MNQNEARNLLMGIKAVYQNFQLSEVLPDLWNELLTGITYSEALDGIKTFMRSGSKFAPVPGEIIEIVFAERARKRRLENEKNHTKKLLDSPKFDLRATLDDERLKKLIKLAGK